jgi:large subunit ribosomal protein L31
MKKDIHPDYRFVVYKDIGADFSILTRSTAVSDQTVTWEDGQVYPLIEVEISSATHPFFTGHQRLVDSAGRIEKFQRKYKKA